MLLPGIPYNVQNQEIELPLIKIVKILKTVFYFVFYFVTDDGVPS